VPLAFTAHRGRGTRLVLSVRHRDTALTYFATSTVQDSRAEPADCLRPAGWSDRRATPRLHRSQRGEAEAPSQNGTSVPHGKIRSWNVGSNSTSPDRCPVVRRHDPRTRGEREV